jgi:glucosamine--fructose-6-phosphate aminotransferase (isomerizing)
MSLLERELRDQPEKLAGLIGRTRSSLDILATLLDRTGSNHLVLAARGSSDNAARYGQYLFGLQNELVVALATPSLTSIYGRPPRFDGAAVVAVSQSGQSPDVVSVAEAARRQQRPTIAVTNDADSPLAEECDHVLDLGVEPERAVAATGTYTGSLLALAMLSTAMLDEPGSAMEALEALPELMAQTIEDSFAQIDGYELPTNRPLTVVGRGLNYATAFETALKVRELTGISSEAFSPPDLEHGPIVSLTTGSPVVLVAPDEPSTASVAQFVPRLQSRGVQLIVISGNTDLLAQADVRVRLPRQPAAHLTPITTIVAGQVLALRTAEARGLDVDNPDNLTKVTTTR